MSVHDDGLAAVYYRLRYRDDLVDAGMFSQGDRHAISIELPLTGRQRLLDVSAEVRAFVMAGAAHQQYAVEAVEVFEKFGEAIENRTEFTLQLSSSAFS